MDNATYDELHMNETQFHDDETYSQLSPTQMENPPGYGQQRTTGDEQTDDKKYVSSKDNPKYLVVQIVVIVILLVLVSASIALSVTTYSLLSEQSKVIAQIEKTNSKIVYELTTAQSKISQLDAIISRNQILQSQTQCGPGLWYRLIYINMSDPSQQCPPVWREYSNSGVRACGRPVSESGSCPAIITSSLTHIQYSRVCGRVIGFQHASTDAFAQYDNNNIDFDGINITYGVKHNHIWSYVAGVSQNDFAQHPSSKCPCAEGGTDPPEYFRDNYYCESGNSNARYTNKLYTDDPLWDGQECEGTCCNGTNSPPWFSVQLPSPTTDEVEVRICCDQGTRDEDVPVELIEIYVQ